MRGDSVKNPLVCFGELLEDWVHENPEPMKIKARKTGRYILANTPAAALFGLTPNEMIGLDIVTVGKKNHLKASYIQGINEMDYRVIHNAETTRAQQVFFTPQKTIYIKAITKQPIFGHKNTVVGILNHSRDVTSYADLHSLFFHYQDLYCRVLKKPQRAAIEAFLKYLKVDGFFSKMPTLQELSTLLAMRKVSQTKYVASMLGINPRTVDTHKTNLRGKLRTFDWSQLLLKLRTHHEGNGSA